MSEPASLEATETEHGKAILYWIEELEKVKQGYASLLRHENPVYEKQIQALEENHRKKIEVLEKWRNDKLAFIENEKQKKIELLRNECERHRKDIPRLLERSIREQFDQLQREFPNVFIHLTEKGIPFIDAFAHNMSTQVCTIYLNKTHLEPKDVRADFHKVEAERVSATIDDGQLKLANGGILDVGSVCEMSIGAMKPFKVTVSEIGSNYLEFLGEGRSYPMRVTLEAIQMNIVTLTK